MGESEYGLDIREQKGNMVNFLDRIITTLWLYFFEIHTEVGERRKITCHLSRFALKYSAKTKTNELRTMKY